MGLLAEQRTAMAALAPQVDVGILRIDARSLRNALLPVPASKLEALHALLPRLASGKRWVLVLGDCLGRMLLSALASGREGMRTLLTWLVSGWEGMRTLLTWLVSATR